MLFFKDKKVASPSAAYSCEVVLYAKEDHIEAQAPYEKFIVVKFDAPAREPQDGLATRDPLAHLELKLTPGVAQALVPVLQRHPKGASLLPEHVGGGPEVQPEIFVEGRKYKITIEAVE